jgi:hypothetical protein
MVKERKDIAGNVLFTTSRGGPETLTHKAVEDYLSKGRRMQSAYVWGLLRKPGSRLRATLIRSAGWFQTLKKDPAHRIPTI